VIADKTGGCMHPLDPDYAKERQLRRVKHESKLEIVPHAGYSEGAIIAGGTFICEYRKPADSEYGLEDATGANLWLIAGNCREKRRVFNVHPRHPTNDGRHGFPIRWELRDYEMDEFDTLVKVPPPINGFVQW
jgi:hypothetical protein